jgi:molybdopterin molybdotransferase
LSESVLSFEEALAVVLHEAGKLPQQRETERVSLREAEGRVLANVLRADRDQPPFDRSTRDGYAVRAQDCGAPIRVVGTIRAGEVWRSAPVGAGQAVEIMTGAPLPEGADAVIMVEHVLAVDETVEVTVGRQVSPGQNVVPRGAEAHADDALLPIGCAMGAAEIAVAASCGCAELDVFARPKVAIVATGDELVELDEVPEPWQIRNSNSYALAALVRAEGGFAGRLQIARDTRDDLDDRLAQAEKWDLMLLSGGVSMGKYDLVEQVLAERGAEFFFTGAMIQPGKPIVFGRIPRRGSYETTENGEIVPINLESPWRGEWTYFFGLPGNPVSTQVCFHLFVAPLLRALAGRNDLAPRFVEAKLAEDVAGGAKVMRFLPAELVSAWEGVTVRVVGWQGSGDVAANARGNCYAVLPIGPETFRAGETVRVLLR